MPDKQDLIEHLKHSGALKTPTIIKAFEKIDRIDFVPDEYLQEAYLDTPLHITQGLTISQPSTVAFMLELLKPKKAQIILDIGAGTGWVAAILAEIVGENGCVYAYEINPEMGSFAEEKLQKYQLENLEYNIANASDHWQSHSPYDRIHCGAAFEEIPADLLRYLKIGGIIVTPTQKGEVKKITHSGEKQYKFEDFRGFRFLPFKKSP